jgi:hypothetical protein
LVTMTMGFQVSQKIFSNLIDKTALNKFIVGHGKNPNLCWQAQIF